MSRLPDFTASDRLRFVVSLRSDLDDAVIPLDHSYVQRYWLPVVGPTALWLARFTHARVGSELLAADVAGALGVNVLTLRNACERLKRYGWGGATRTDSGAWHLSVAARVHSVPDSLARKCWPPFLWNEWSPMPVTEQELQRAAEETVGVALAPLLGLKGGQS